MNYDFSITICGNTAKLAGTFPVDVIKDITSYYVAGYRYTFAYKHGRWDGKKHLFHEATGTFPAGLTTLIKETVLGLFPTASITISDKTPTHTQQSQNGFDLVGIDFGKGKWDYQIKAAETMVARRRGILKLATGSGKTACAAAVTKHLAIPTLFLVDRLNLVYQTRKRFAAMLGVFEKSIGVVGDGGFEIGDWITIATPASLKPHLNKTVKPDHWSLVFGDEIHRAAANIAYFVLMALESAYKIGMSGTPLDRSDGADLRLIAATGPIIYEVSNKELVKRGVTVPPSVELYKVDKPVIVKRGLRYGDVEKLGIIQNEMLNSIVVAKALEHSANNRQVLIVIDKIAHGTLIRDRLKDCVTVAFMQGKEPTDARQKILADFVAGTIKVLIGSSVMDEGIDVPCIDVLILAAGGKSKIRLLQRVGRGLRTNQGKDALLIIDFNNCCHKWLLKHSLERLRTYKREDCFDIVSKTV